MQDANVRPIRIELREVESGHTCNLTIEYPFIEIPSKGDYIVIKDSSLLVTGKCHYINNDQPLVVILTSSFVAASYDDLLKVLDWFKDHFRILELTADSEPPPHYNLYRSIISLLNIRGSNINFDNNEEFNAFCDAGVAVLMSVVEVDSEDDTTRYKTCKPWGDLLKLLVKQKYQKDKFNIINIIREWNSKLIELGNLDRKWLIDTKICRQYLDIIHSFNE